MKRIGDMLRSARLSQGYSLSDVERATKIRVKFLNAIEEENFQAIPSPVYTKGFVKNYSEFLGLDSRMVLAFFRRQQEDVSRTTLLPSRMSEPLQPKLLEMTPGRFITILLSVMLLIFFGYFFLQYRHLQTAPVISLEKPQADQMFEERKIDVVGSTNQDATITINGIGTLVRTDGKFFDQVSLEPGVNTITITATSRYGKTTTLVRKVGLKQ